MRVLILDDDANRHAAFLAQYAGEGVEVVQAFTTLEAIAALELWSPLDVVQLGHSLSPGAGDCGGEDVARYIAAMPVANVPARIVIHAHNPAGAVRMHSILAAAGIRHATYRPFGPPDNAVVASMRADFEHYQAHQLQADIEAEQQGRLALRRRFGAREDETMGALLERLATMAGAVPVEVHERGWQWRPIDKNTAFAPPFGTIRQCRVCGCLVAGGPTACARCAKAGV